ncbi:MAG: 1,4-alpha-glucan branching enzyme, partial [Opitutae bacterium]
MSSLKEELDRLQRGLCSQPHALLGMHPVDGGVVVRTLQPGAQKCFVVEIDGNGQQWEMDKFEDAFEIQIQGREVFPYRLHLEYSGGHEKVVEDPYRFLPTVSDEALHDFGRYGDPWIYKKTGVRKLEHQGAQGWSFSVWAPKAFSVYLVFYPEYDPPVSYCMRSIGSTGVWEIFVPNVPLGMRYKFHIRTQAGDVLNKTDPMALDSEGPPNHASILTDLDEYSWGDQDWMEKRNQEEWLQKPMSVYEVHMGSWMEGVDSYREAAEKLGDYVKKMGFTHVE